MNITALELLKLQQSRYRKIAVECHDHALDFAARTPGRRVWIDLAFTARTLSDDEFLHVDTRN